MNSVLLVRDFIANGSNACLGGFVLPHVTENTMSLPNKVVRLLTLSERLVHSFSPVRKECRNLVTLSGMTFCSVFDDYVRIFD